MELVREYRKARREVVLGAVARIQQATGAAGTVALKLRPVRTYRRPSDSGC